jgi:hypothetical protein
MRERFDNLKKNFEAKGKKKDEIENCELKLENGKWQMANGKWQKYG